MTRKEKSVGLWRLVRSFFSGHKKARISKEQKGKAEQAAEDERLKDTPESPKVSAKRHETQPSTGEPERVDLLPGLSVTTRAVYHVSEEEKRVRELMKTATALSDTDPNAAVETFREAAALVLRTGTDYGVAPFLRVPRYLQQAGRQEEAWEEFQRLLKGGYPNMQKGKETWYQMESAVYDKMRLFLQREKRLEEAVLYGVRSIIAGIRVWTVPTDSRRHRLESEVPKIREREQERLRSSESHRMKRLQHEQAKETLDTQLTKLLKRARLQPCHDEALSLLCEWANDLPEADDVAYEAKLQNVLG